MKRKKITKLIVAAICLVAFSASAAFASNVARTITVYYQDIKMYVDGQRVNTSSEPFIYNGSTYLPVRAISEALGEEVYWDGNTKSVYIGERPGTTQYLMDVCPPYQKYCVYDYYSNNQRSFSMAGIEYNNGFHCYNNGGYIYFNLNGKYNLLSAIIGPLDGSQENINGTISFEVDGITVASYNFSGGDLPGNINVPLNGGDQLIVRIAVDNSSMKIGVGNISVK